MPWTYEDAIRYLDEHVNFEAVAIGRTSAPTLDRMVRLSGLMADPQLAQPSIHVTGTNGKGTTSRIISALLMAHNLSVGTYTSPDLERVNERLAWNLEAVDDEAFAAAIEAVAEIEGLSGIRPTRFEVLTLAAFRWFADVAVDVAVVEVGLAGRWDATNVVQPVVAVVTNVGLDHTDTLGPTRAHIAREKAGIVKPGATLVIGETAPDLVAIFEAEGPARTWRRDRDFGLDANTVAVGGRALTIRTPGAVYDDVFLGLHGAHQGDNAAVAVAAVEAFFDRPLADELVREALAAVDSPGRFEIVGRSPLVILDGAHNADGAKVAGATLDDFQVEGERILVVGMNRGRDPAEMLEALGAHLARGVVACASESSRAMDPHDIAAAARGLGVDVEVVPSVADAVRRALVVAGPADLVLVAGSLYVVGEARPVLRP